MEVKLKIILILLGITLLASGVHSEEGDEDAESDKAKETNTEEEWHMDFMPTGYLPDSVYRELAWYGILQINPLHHSSKYKVAAQLMWQHTLGRPHVIMERPPQSTQSPGKTRQEIAEEAAKWSREQRAAQEVNMETIKTGGNGITVRTVVSSREKSVYIIQNSNFYKCPPGSEPDMDQFRIEANIHERKCTYGKESIPVAIDPCIEAEIAPIEYSFHEGWMFCLGNGDRENNYFQNGTLDCGDKTKVSVSDFLDFCAIDNNVVITFDYFGDEPRKGMIHNDSVCSSWDPCRISYLYRLEPPPVEMTPSFPTTSQNPCETTVCPDCLEGNTDDPGLVIDLGALSDSDLDIDLSVPEDAEGPEGKAKPTAKLVTSPVMQGQSADLTCEVPMRTDHKFTWLFKRAGEDKFLDLDNSLYDIADNGGKVTIKKVDENTVGAYKCISHKTESDEVEVRLEASDSGSSSDHRPPKLTLETTPLEAKKPAELKCVAQGNPTDSDQVKWSFKKTGEDFKEIKDGPEYEMTEAGQTMLIKHLDEKTMGSYKCQFHSPDSNEIEVKAELDNSGGATPTAKLTKEPKGDDKKAELECSVEGVTDSDPVSWVFKKTGETTFKDVHSGEEYLMLDQGKKLQIPAVGPDTEGAYKCTFKGAESSEVAVGASGGATPDGTSKPDEITSDKPSDQPTEKTPDTPADKPKEDDSVKVELSAAVDDGKPVTLSCTAKAGAEPYTWSFKKKGAADFEAIDVTKDPFKDKATVDKEKLTITAYAADYEGEYKCKTGEQESKPLEVTKGSGPAGGGGDKPDGGGGTKPEITVAPDKIESGKPVTLTCSTATDTDKATWKFTATGGTATDIPGKDAKTLEIAAFAAANEGDYTCTVKDATSDPKNLKLPATY